VKKLVVNYGFLFIIIFITAIVHLLFVICSKKLIKKIHLPACKNLQHNCQLLIIFIFITSNHKKSIYILMLINKNGQPSHVNL